MIGQSGRMKANKLLIPVERGHNKIAYSRRKVFGDLISNIIARGDVGRWCSNFFICYRHIFLRKS